MEREDFSGAIIVFTMENSSIIICMEKEKTFGLTVESTKETGKII